MGGVVGKSQHHGNLVTADAHLQLPAFPPPTPPPPSRFASFTQTLPKLGVCYSVKIFWSVYYTACEEHSPNFDHVFIEKKNKFITQTLLLSLLFLTKYPHYHCWNDSISACLLWVPHATLCGRDPRASRAPCSLGISSTLRHFPTPLLLPYRIRSASTSHCTQSFHSCPGSLHPTCPPRTWICCEAPFRSLPSVHLFTLITTDFHNIKNINGANCTRAQSLTRWNPQRLDISFRLRAGSRPWLLGSQMPLESWDAAWLTALFWLVDRLQPLKVYHALLFLVKGEDPYSTVQHEDIEPPFLAFLAVTHLRWHWD